MFVKIEGSYINLALVHSIDLDDDGTATLWFTGADGACRDVTADDLKIIEAAIRHECVFEEIEPPSPRWEADVLKAYQKSKDIAPPTADTHSVVDACKAAGLPIAPVGKED